MEIALLKIYLANLYVSQIDNKGQLKSIEQDKPNTLTQEAFDMIERIIGNSNEYNYLRSKSLAAMGKVALIQKNVTQAEELFKKSQWEVTASFGDVHPLAVKFNQYLVETYNLKAQGAEAGKLLETSKLLNDICDTNLTILQTFYGDTSIYNVRTMYTLYTARLQL